jgi:hypothetical protein
MERPIEVRGMQLSVLVACAWNHFSSSHYTYTKSFSNIYKLRYLGNDTKK